MIKRNMPESEDRVIHSVYTPKEINHILRETTNDYVEFSKLTRSEYLLIWEFINYIYEVFNDE